MPVVNAAVTDDSLREIRELIGKPVDRSRQQWNTVASVDAIRHWAWGIGDLNPLWLDPAYAAKTRFGGIIAPPLFLYSIDSTVVFPGLPGLARIFAGVTWEWLDVVRAGERITPDAQFIDARDARGKRGGRMILQTGHVDYFGEDGRKVAGADHRSFRTARSGQEGGMRYEPREAYSYSPDELHRIEHDVFAEERRGNVPRYWEDVVAGQELTPVVKGPLSLTDMISWYCGNGPHGRRPHEIFWQEMRDNPDFYYRVPETGSHEFSERGHYDPFMAHQVGMPGPYDNGMQRSSWFGHLLSDWMGDEGFLKRFHFRALRPNIFGDTTWCRGTVVDKRSEGSERIVVVKLTGVNQLGEVNSDGEAAVRLPGRP